MDILQTRGKEIIDSSGRKVRLRGTCIGGWMNLENFIDGFPGTEHGIRAAVAKVLGEEKAEFLFERMLDYFFNEGDIKFIRQCGANAVRLPLNYRHFEDDREPFKYKAKGFERLDKVIQWCEDNDLYVILDLHAVPGWQNSHWHSDNDRGISLLWSEGYYQDRTVALWKEIAGRYKGRAAVAGYNIMNEPCTNTADGDYPFNAYENYSSNWEAMNRLYSRLVKEIRSADPEHIIFIEGDNYARLFKGLEAPMADNLVYSSHNYILAGFGPGKYPGKFGKYKADLLDEDGYWDRGRQYREFRAHEGTQYADKYNVPLWVGEFGAQYNCPADEIPDRLSAMDDQLSVFEEYGAHWTTWTYKDVGVMGWVTLDPESPYMKLIAPVQEKKNLLGAENFTGRFVISPAKKEVDSLAALMEEIVGDPGLDHGTNNTCLQLVALAGYAAALLQPVYANLFKGMTEEDIDVVMQSFDIRNCKVNEGLVEVLKKHMD
ncbi:MAG: glycoside hydrolase family 5 protein [Bacillota bacterium]|nr:glycoside hydrolase family 5 protein [Bacillota bacterium]